MSEAQLRVEINVYSPRWGHNDTHSLTMSKDKLHFSGNGPGANCTRDEYGNYEWSGYGNTGNPLIAVLKNDSIYPPIILIDALICLWEDWIKCDISSKQVKEELKALFDWVNICSHNKVSTEYWKKIF